MPPKGILKQVGPRSPGPARFLHFIHPRHQCPLPEPYFRILSPSEGRGEEIPPQASGTRLQETGDPGEEGPRSSQPVVAGHRLPAKSKREASGVRGARVARPVCNLGFSSCFFCLF